jgi:hypothetical protein
MGANMTMMMIDENVVDTGGNDFVLFLKETIA